MTTASKRDVTRAFSTYLRQVAEVPFEITPDVETGILHRCVEAAAEAARTHPVLHRLADLPVLPIDHVPEFDHVGGIEMRLCDLVRMEQELAGDARVIRPRGPECEGRDVFR